jgi:hypothetical protein
MWPLLCALLCMAIVLWLALRCSCSKTRSQIDTMFVVPCGTRIKCIVGKQEEQQKQQLKQQQQQGPVAQRQEREA